MFGHGLFQNVTTANFLQLDGGWLGLRLALLETLLGLSGGNVALASITLVDQELGVHLEGGERCGVD